LQRNDVIPKIYAGAVKTITKAISDNSKFAVPAYDIFAVYGPNTANEQRFTLSDYEKNLRNSPLVWTLVGSEFAIQKNK
jgi:hypothetical protein